MRTLLKQFFVAFFAIGYPTIAFSTEHWIIVHGTFAKQSTWYLPESKECKALAETLTEKKRDFSLHALRWSGEHNHNARTKAAKELVRLIKNLHRIGEKTKNPATFHIIAHSHGGTVALLAAEKLFEEYTHIRIAESFILGMPVYEPWYPHVHEQIDTIYNFFSYGDNIQRVGVVFERTVAERSNVHNIQLRIDGQCPGHSDLYRPLFFQNLPLLSALITQPGPYLMHLYPNRYPECLIGIDATREKDLIADKAFTEQLVKILSDSRKKSLT